MRPTEGDDPESDHNGNLSPALEFEVVMQRTHQKYSPTRAGLPLGYLEEDALYDYRAGDDYKNSTDKQK